jgi:4-hydroxy-3-polyprenylbenzoate decarboxylase
LKKPHKRIAIAVGIDPNVDRFTFFLQYMPKTMNMLRPVEVATGPCKEVIKMGKDINLFEYPFTYHAIGDGGRYILQNCTIIKDPDSDWVNSGDYGIEIYSRNRLVLSPQTQTNWVMIYSTKYELRGQSMPCAIALGGDPAITLAAGTMLPPGVTEFDYAGGLRGTPAELVRAETSDLLVPADAEMVIEGEVRPYERLPEGPKIENFAFSVGPRQPLYAMRVHCITHRKNPILWDVHTALGTGAMYLNEVLFPNGCYLIQKAMGMPIKMSTYPGPSHGGIGYRFSIYDKPYPGFMRDLFDMSLGNPVTALFNYMYYMDSDVDILDYGEVEEAIHTQANPMRDWIRSDSIYSTSFMGMSYQEEEDRAKYYRSATMAQPRLLVDATSKEEPPLGVSRTCFETLVPDELQQWVVENWQRLGFKEEAVWKKAWREAKL